ncbi:MAG: V-type ATPase subunit [Candidatus Methanomethylicaceae archaeon]
MEALRVGETTFAVVRASARKGDLLTDQQIIDLASSKDLKELVNKIKDRYPALLNISVLITSEAVEETLLKSFCDEVEEFIEVFPKARDVLKILRQEVEEAKAARILVEELKEGKKKSYGDTIAKLEEMGFEDEAREGERIFARYGIPGLVTSAFARCRLLKTFRVLKDYKAEVSKVLTGYLSLKVDQFNLATLLRGIKNDIRRDALEELLILGRGTIKDHLLKDAVKAPDVKKALSILGISSYQEDLRSIERAIERKIRGVLTRAYYEGYTDLAAVVGYLELKRLEVINITRIANCISRGIEPKRILQEFIL